jgi:hypothetical protein
MIFLVTDSERRQGYKDLSLALRDGGAEMPVRVWRLNAERLAEFNAMPSQTERVRVICQSATRLDSADFETLHGSAWPQIYFAAFGLISAERQHLEILRAREIGRDLIVENLPGGSPANN